jgi:Uma2 family endonuclease
MKPTGTSSAPEQQFPYGWRDVRRTLPDGREDLVQVALTLEDVLHPQEGDVIPENTDHDADCIYLATVFRDRPLSPPFAFVSRDLLVDWSVEGIRNHSPDVAVFVGLSRDPRPTGLLDLAAFAGRCELIIEVVSPNTRENDVVHKFGHYHTVGIPLYVIIDQEKENGPRTLRAYRREPSRYAEIAPDDRGRVDLPLLDLKIGLLDNRAACFDLRTNEELDDYSRIARALEEAERKLEEADRRAEQQEQAIADKIGARQEAEREAEKQRLAREAADRDNVAKAQRILELEEKLRLLQAGTDPTNPTA